MVVVVAVVGGVVAGGGPGGKKKQNRQEKHKTICLYLEIDLHSLHEEDYNGEFVNSPSCGNKKFFLTFNCAKIHMCVLMVKEQFFPILPFILFQTKTGTENEA